MNTILIPTDFSPIADNAIKYAIAMAAHYKLDISLFHVVALPPASIDMAYVDLSDQFQKTANEEMLKLVEGLRAAHPNQNFQSKVVSGLFVDSLKHYCEETKPIAVLMGITGENTTFDKMVGSNSIIAMKHLHDAIMVIPKHAEFKPVRKICFACDLKQVANSTPIVSIKAFAKLFDAEVHMLNVDFENRHFTAETQSELETLNEMFESIETVYHFIEHENVQDAIDEFIKAHNMDVLIMLPKKHSFVEGLFRKSRTKEMLYHSHVPILALHA